MKHKSFKREADVSDEWMAAYVQGLLLPQDKEKIEQLMAGDDRLREEVRALMDICREQETGGLQPPPDGFSQTVKDRVRQCLRPGVLHVVAVIAEGVLRTVRTTGELLVGPHIAMEHTLRNGKKSAMHTSVFQKKFAELLVRGELTVGEHNRSTLVVTLQPGQTWPDSKRLRVTLKDEEGELGSQDYTGEGVVFEDILPGKYDVIISEDHTQRAGIALCLENVSWPT
ncbi:MAG TPA: hypothetical protein PLD92_03370 [Candidatus Omnitrophota bacterium]|nr:hypothetical protein [Candidatus Omnitrophota bacterium]